MSNNTNKVNSALNTKSVNTDCNKCGGQQQISSQPFTLTTGTDGDLQGSVDCSALICTNCGHTDLFVDEILGV